MARPRALALYRDILRTLELWPSVRRRAVYAEIQQEFRQNMHESEPAVAPKFIAQQCATLEIHARDEPQLACDSSLLLGRFIWARPIDEANELMDEYMRTIAPPPPRDSAAPRRGGRR